MCTRHWYGEYWFDLCALFASCYLWTLVSQLQKVVSPRNAGILSSIFQTGAGLVAAVITPVTGIHVDQIKIDLGDWFLT